MWQTSESVDEVLRRLGGKNRRTVIQRAARYRAGGVALKRMPTKFEKVEALDWEGLSSYAESFSERGE